MVIEEKCKLLPGTKLLPFSAQTKQGREEIWEVIEGMIGVMGDTEETSI